MKQEKGITLVALIITIIILIILAAVTLQAAFKNNFIDIATKGTENYSQAQMEEQRKIDETADLLEETVSNIISIQGANPAEKPIEPESPEKPGGPLKPIDPTSVYAKLYTDGILILSSFDYTDEGKTIAVDYGDISKKTDNVYPEWEYEVIKEVIVYDEIAPTSTAFWFYRSRNPDTIEKMDLSKLNTSNVTNMDHMFYNCNSITDLDLSSFNTKNVTNMELMFGWCSSLTNVNLKSFNTEKVTSMRQMFTQCNSLIDLDLSNFNTENVTDMSNMFNYCISLVNLDLNNFNTENVTNMTRMFDRCLALSKLDISNFNTENVTNMSRMFNRCSGLTSLDISNFNTSNTNIREMFIDCNNLKQLYIGSKVKLDSSANVPSGCEIITK